MLIDLVALIGVGGEVGEVGIEIQVVVQGVDIQLIFIVLTLARRIDRAAVAVGDAPIGGIHGAKSAIGPKAVLSCLIAAGRVERFAQLRQRNLVGGDPVTVIGLAVQRYLPVRVAERVLEHTVVFVAILRHHPRTVVEIQLPAYRQIAIPDVVGVSDQGPVEVELPALEQGITLVAVVVETGQPVLGGHPRIAGGGEIALIRVIRAFTLKTAVRSHRRPYQG